MWFLGKNWIYYDLLKINNKKDPEMKIFIKIMKLTNQMISISSNSHMSWKLMTRGFQRYPNFWISPGKLGVIAFESQHPNSNWKWTPVGQTSNSRAKCWWDFKNQIHRKPME